ncbi:phage terminase, small subunit [hydrocarbon metagenome]|uniref:Phage terminase, small subunit n=1 Tax=hydrocarbon metagenome TaxID=938273 RepID=A0A0W8G166_9ZZZZ
MKKGLTDKQKRFVEEYCIDFNKTQAAIRAGYSKNRAAEIGGQNYRKLHVKKAIDQRIKRRKKKLEITEKEIIAELAKIGFSDMSKYYEPGFELKDITTLPNEFTAAIKEVVKIDNDKGTRIGIKFYAKVQALELLGKHLGMWNADQSDKDWNITIDYITKPKLK